MPYRAVKAWYRPSTYGKGKNGRISENMTMQTIKEHNNSKNNDNSNDDENNNSNDNRNHNNSNENKKDK